MAKFVGTRGVGGQKWARKIFGYKTGDVNIQIIR